MTTQSGSLPVHRRRTACFFVIAAPKPGAMPRVLENFAKRGLVPSKWLGNIAEVHSRELHIDIQLEGVDTELSERLAQSLRQIVSVRSLLTSEKRLLLFA